MSFILCSITLGHLIEVEPLTSLRSGGQGLHFLPPLCFFCCTEVRIFNRSPFLFLISYLQMLLYVLDFFSAQVIAGMPRSSPIFKIYTTGTIFITHDMIVVEQWKGLSCTLTNDMQHIVQHRLNNPPLQGVWVYWSMSVCISEMSGKTMCMQFPKGAIYTWEVSRWPIHEKGWVEVSTISLLQCRLIW